MIRVRPALWSCLVLLAPPAAAQDVEVPEGATRFMVLVDRSWSMVGGKPSNSPERQAKRTLKQRNLQHAIDAILEALMGGPTNGGAKLNLPRFQPGRDTVSVGRFGIDAGPVSTDAWKRLSNAQMGADYFEVVYPPSDRPTRKGLRSALNPGWPLRNLNILAWAVPMGFARMRPASGQRVQATYLVMLNDAQMNEGSIGLENEMYRPKLSKRSGEILDRAVEDLIGHIRFVKERDQGLPGAVGRAVFGSGNETILATAYKVVPRGRGENVPQGKPRDVRAAWVREGEAWRLNASALAPEGAKEGESRLALDGQEGSWKPTGESLSASLNGRVPRKEGYGLPILLTLANDYSDPLLGVSRFTTTYRDSAWVPASPEQKKGMVGAILAGLASFVAAAVLFGWVGWRRWGARDFAITLPGGGTSLELPPLSGPRTVEGWVRIPRDVGETAFVLKCPPKWIRRLFYRKTTVTWEPILQVNGFGAAVSASALDLPHYARFVWATREDGTATTTVKIVRRSFTGATGRIVATIHHPAAFRHDAPRFDSLPAALD